MTLADLTAILSEIGRKHPELVADEKVKRYILLLVEEGRSLHPQRTVALAPIDFSDL